VPASTRRTAEEEALAVAFRRPPCCRALLAAPPGRPRCRAFPADGPPGRQLGAVLLFAGSRPAPAAPGPGRATPAEEQVQALAHRLPPRRGCPAPAASRSSRQQAARPASAPSPSASQVAFAQWPRRATRVVAADVLRRGRDQRPDPGPPGWTDHGVALTPPAPEWLPGGHRVDLRWSSQHGQNRVVSSLSYAEELH